jgi:hypothetical protein
MTDIHDGILKDDLEYLKYLHEIGCLGMLQDAPMLQNIVILNA